jgi:hypothetical protein
MVTEFSKSELEASPVFMTDSAVRVPRLKDVLAGLFVDRYSESTRTLGWRSLQSSMTLLPVLPRHSFRIAKDIVWTKMEIHD